ncbi:winged helix-turn-helix domain-containing protein [Dactylosporangium sp. CS-047395]|uniref:winged helix-turn-helix domain-containing protein n=1 Tax=Dactylosporangium sp. CS-047395 TaxID=3239936 RepID=UPI003D8E0011
MLDRRSGMSLYRQLAYHLLERVRVGELVAGSYLPSEAALSGEYGVSRDVVRDAMGVLRTEGIIVTTRGRRSSVRKAIAVEELQAPPAARITVRMPTYDERHRHDMLEGVPLIVIHTDEFESYHPAERVAIITPPADERG